MLLTQIQRKLQSQAVKIRADIEVSCFEYEGIDAVKSALRGGIEMSTSEIPIRINLIAPPLYGGCVGVCVVGGGVFIYLFIYLLYVNVFICILFLFCFFLMLYGGCVCVCVCVCFFLML